MLGADTTEIHLVDGFPMDVCVTTRARKNMIDSRPKWFVRQLMKIRRRIETVIGQLVDYFEIEPIRTRDTWHLTSHIVSKLLGFTVGIYLNIQAGSEPVQFEGLITT